MPQLTNDKWLSGLILTLGVLVLMTPLIWVPDVLYPWITGKTAYARALILVMGGASVFLMLQNFRYRPQSSLVIAAFGAYLLVALAATMFSVSPTRSFWSEFGRMVGVVDYLLAFLYVLCLVAVLRSAAQWRALLGWAVAGVMAVELLALAQMAHLLNVAGMGSCRIGSTTGNPTYLGALLAVALPLSAVLLAEHAGRTHPRGLSAPWREGARLAWAYRGFLLASIGLGVAALFFTGSRGALLGVLIGGVAAMAGAWFVGGRAMLRQIAAPVGAMLALVAAGSALSLWGVDLAPPGCSGSGASERLLSTAQTTVATAKQATEVAPLITTDQGAAATVGQSNGENEALSAIAQAGLGMRWDLWRMGVNAWLARPWLGWGPENVAAAYLRNIDKGLAGKFSPMTDFSKPHNRLVEELVATGALGTTAYLALWLAMGVVLLRRHGSTGARVMVRWGAADTKEPSAHQMRSKERGIQHAELGMASSFLGPQTPPLLPSSPLLACAVFGALTGYFVANLFMFDTPATLWHWALLVGWAAWYGAKGRLLSVERTPSGGAPASRVPSSEGVCERSSAWLRLSRPVRVIGVLAVTLAVAEGVLLSSVGPLMAAREFKKFADGAHGAAAQLASVRKGFELSPMPTSAQTRQHLRALRRSWSALPPELQAEGYRTAVAEVEKNAKAEPLEMGPVADLATFYVATAQTRDELARAQPLLDTLYREVPGSAFTVWVAAYYRIRSGDARQAVRLIDDYVGGSATLASTFKGLRDAAVRRIQG